ncbi:MAG: histidinol-phosphate transaminase [Pseudomonadota bacterium]
MRKLIHQGIENLVPYPPGKPIEELERELGISGSIKLASNENPLGPSPLALEAITRHLKTLNRYPDGRGYYLKSKLSNTYGLTEEQIIIGNGSNELIELVIRTFLSPGDGVIQAFPTFLVYEKIVTGAGGKMVSVPLSSFRIDLDAIRDTITGETKIIFINNPNNPTGSALSKEEMIDFLKSIPRDILIVMDEAYIEFTTDEGVARGLDLLSEYPLLVVLRTFSKIYGLAGLRIGYGFGQEKIINYMNRVRQPFNANTLAQVAATAALDDTDFVKRTLKLIRDGISYYYQQLGGMGLEYIPTQTNFLLIKVPSGGRRTYERMLREGVIIRSMESYGLGDYIRVNVGLPEENERFIIVLKKIVNDHLVSGMA